MNWQEYQDAVAVLYEQADGFGRVKRNVMVPDKVTGQPRQIDVLIQTEAKGHPITLVVDAKFHAAPIDVREVESVLALAESVRAHKAVIVAANGWTEPAETKADHAGCDLRLLSMEEALDLIISDKWMMCPSCGNDCIVLDQDGVIGRDNGLWFWWLAGQCRECRCACVECQDCGEKGHVELKNSWVCGCRHRWLSTAEGVAIEFSKETPEW